MYNSLFSIDDSFEVNYIMQYLKIFSNFDWFLLMIYLDEKLLDDLIYSEKYISCCGAFVQ